jgi:hypothetical protein
MNITINLPEELVLDVVVHEMKWNIDFCMNSKDP